MLEGDYQKILAKETSLLGAVVLNKIGSFMEGPGWPDIYIAHPIWTGWLELKVDAKELDTQIDRIAAFRRNGVDARFMRLVPKAGAEITTNDRNEDLGIFVPLLNDNYSKPDPKRGVERLRFLRNSNVTDA